MIQKPLKDRIKILAKKYNIEPSKIEEIEHIMWQFVRDNISKGEKDNVETFENIYLRYLGTFHVQRGMVINMKKRKDDK